MDFNNAAINSLGIVRLGLFDGDTILNKRFTHFVLRAAFISFLCYTVLFLTNITFHLLGMDEIKFISMLLGMTMERLLYELEFITYEK